MIAGTLVLEDLTLQFRMETDKPGLPVAIVACDSATGQEAPISCSAEEFGASLAIALSGEGFEGAPALQAGLYTLAERIPFPKEADGSGPTSVFRWIP